MDWTQWLPLSPNAFARRMRRRLAKPIQRNDFIALYNALIVLAPNDHERVAAIADAAALLLRKRNRLREALDMIELAARAHFLGQNPKKGFDRLDSMISLDAEGAKETVLELAQDVMNDSDSFGASIDQRPDILASVSKIYGHYEEYEKVASIHLEAAMLYSRHGAYQSAYRSLADAETVARRLRSPLLLARVLKSGVMVGIEESDREYAIRSGRRAHRIYRLIGEETPIDLLSNLGLAYMNEDAPEMAVSLFEEALARTPEQGSLRGALQTNLASAYRRMGRYDEAMALLEKADRDFEDKDWPEHRLEHELAFARLAADMDQAPALANRLKRVAEGLDAMLEKVLRLHHRRGIRERYLNHIERLMSRLPDEGDAADVLAPLAAARGNALGDWLVICAWADEIRADGRFDQALRDELSSTLLSLREFGAPHLYGYREKYDDAWSSMNRGRLWDQLSNVAARVVAAEGPEPMAGAAVSVGIDLCSVRLDEGHALMATTHTQEAGWLWLLINGRYHRTSVDRKVLVEWQVALYRYASGQIDRHSFTAALSVFTENYRVALDPLLKMVAERRCRSIRYLPDFGDPPPLAGLILQDPILRTRMLEGDFDVRIVPALQAPISGGPDRIEVLAAMFDPAETLLLSRFEGLAMAAAAGARVRLVTTDDKRDLADILAGVDALLVSTHGNSLAFFTDAYFARMGSSEGEHPIGVEELQRVAPDLSLRLVLLNSCHSATGSGRNFQQGFRTSDVVTIPGLFLTNRLAVAGGSGWPVSDTSAYLYAVLAGQALAAGHEPSKALMVSAARLRDLGTDEAISLLGNVENDQVREEALRRLSNAPRNGAFSHPYITGGLSLYGLL